MTVTFVGSVKSIYLNNIDCHMRCMIKSAIKIMIELIAKKPVISFASWFISSCSLTFAGDCGLKTVVILKIFDVWIAHHVRLFVCPFQTTSLTVHSLLNDSNGLHYQVGIKFFNIKVRNLFALSSWLSLVLFSKIIKALGFTIIFRFVQAFSESRLNLSHQWLSCSGIWTFCSVNVLVCFM